MLRQTGTCTWKWGDKDIPRVASTEGIVMYRRYVINNGMKNFINYIGF